MSWNPLSQRSFVGDMCIDSYVEASADFLLSCPICQLKVKVANEWPEQVRGLGPEIEHRNYSVNDA